MAELTSDKLLFRMEILDRFHPATGEAGDQTVWVNVQVTLAVGELTLTQVNLVMDAAQPDEFYHDLVRLIHRKAVDWAEIWGYLCPGLSVVVRRFDSAYQPNIESDEQLRNYDFLVVLNQNAFLPETGTLSREGPGMYFQPGFETILTFVRDLRSETAITRLLDQ